MLSLKLFSFRICVFFYISLIENKKCMQFQTNKRKLLCLNKIIYKSTNLVYDIFKIFPSLGILKSLGWYGQQDSGLEVGNR